MVSAEPHLPGRVGYAARSERSGAFGGGGAAVPMQQEELRGQTGCLGLSIDEPLEGRAGGQSNIRARHEVRVVRRGLHRETRAVLG